MNTYLDEELRLCLIRFFSAIVERKVKRPSDKQIEDICGVYSNDVITYLRENHIGYYIKGYSHPWSISIQEAQNALQNLTYQYG